MSFYQKYRSEKVEDLDLESVRSVFETMMKSGEIAHAYLFVGPRGLGKTSAARILARLVNCVRNQKSEARSQKLVEPCNECDNCVSIKNGSAVDVMEIDAASHRGIDDIRDLRDKVNLAPSILPKKVYIIDEVHMLTTEAFNALLKTLEEPPAHVMFILCTTEAHKVPETIASRCVKVNFSKATIAELVRSLERAVKGEKLKMADGVLAELAAGLDGSFREGHKLLEQLANQTDAITIQDVRKVLNSVGSNQIEDILVAVSQSKPQRIVEIMEQLEASGADVISLVTKLLLNLKDAIRKEVMLGSKPQITNTKLVRKLIRVIPKVKTSPLPLLPLELALIGVALGNKKNRKENEVRIPETKKIEQIETEQVKTEPIQDKVISNVGFDQVMAGWPDLLAHLAPRNHSVAGLLRSAKPKEIKDKFLTIEVFYKFHKDQLDQEARRSMIEEEIAKLWGPMSVKCVLGAKSEGRIQKVEVGSQSTGITGLKDEEGVKAAEEAFGI